MNKPKLFRFFDYATIDLNDVVYVGPMYTQRYAQYVSCLLRNGQPVIGKLMAVEQNATEQEAMQANEQAFYAHKRLLAMWGDSV